MLTRYLSCVNTGALALLLAFIRVEGRPMGVIANNPAHLSGAIDAPGADKGTRFMQLCDAFDIPILSLCDCPGIMVGPEIEKTAVVRHAARMFVTSANIDVPLMTIVTRKGYGSRRSSNGRWQLQGHTLYCDLAYG